MASTFRLLANRFSYSDYYISQVTTTFYLQFKTMFFLVEWVVLKCRDHCISIVSAGL